MNVRVRLSSAAAVLVSILLLGGCGEQAPTEVQLRPDGLRVGSVSEAVGKGRHTTVTAELIDLECGGYVADTPGLRELGLEVEHHTNMVFVKIDRPQELGEHLKKNGVLVLPGARMRLVTHLDVDAAGIERARGAFRGFFSPSRAARQPSAAGRR